MEWIATGISLFALVVSIFAVVWQVARSRWERPVVVPSGSMLISAAGDDALAVITISVTNVGERAVTLLWCDLEFWGRQFSQERLANDFPLRLEPHDSRNWQMTLSTRDVGTLDPSKMRVVVRAVQRPTWRESQRGIPAERDIYGRVWTPQH